MTPLKIGACLKAAEIADHRDWLIDAARDIEIQDFMSHAALTIEYEERIAAVTAPSIRTPCCPRPARLQR